MKTFTKFITEQTTLNEEHQPKALKDIKYSLHQAARHSPASVEHHNWMSKYHEHMSNFYSKGTHARVFHYQT